MSKYQVLIALGVWMMVFLFLGFPFFWDKIIAAVTGLLIVLLSYSLRKKAVRSSHASGIDSAKHRPYVEHRGTPQSITSDPATTG